MKSNEEHENKKTGKGIKVILAVLQRLLDQEEAEEVVATREETRI